MTKPPGVFEANVFVTGGPGTTPEID